MFSYFHSLYVHRSCTSPFSSCNIDQSKGDGIVVSHKNQAGNVDDRGYRRDGFDMYKWKQYMMMGAISL